MERKFLEDLGLEKEAIDKVMEENGKDIKGLQKKSDDLTTERDSLKTQLSEVVTKLDAFKGVDLDAKNQEVEDLKATIAANEATYKQQIADRDFSDTIKGAIFEAKGKNEKAIMALLDIEALRGSKNQKDDIAAAIKAVSESDTYLFGEATGAQTTTTVSTGGGHTEPGDISADAFLAAAMKGAGLKAGKEGN